MNNFYILILWNRECHFLMHLLSTIHYIACFYYTLSYSPLSEEEETLSPYETFSYLRIIVISFLCIPDGFSNITVPHPRLSKSGVLPGKSTESKASADFFCILPCRAQMAMFSQPLPYFSWRPQILSLFLHSSTYANVIKTSLSFPTLRMETSLHSDCITNTVFRTNYPSNSNLAAYFHIWSINKLQTTLKQIQHRHILPGLSPVHSVVWKSWPSLVHLTGGTSCNISLQSNFQSLTVALRKSSKKLPSLSNFFSPLPMLSLWCNFSMLIKILNTFSTVSLRTPFTGSAQAQHSRTDKQKTDRFSEHLLNGAMAPAQLFPTSFHTVITLMSSMDSLSNTSSTTSNNKRAESKFV